MYKPAPLLRTVLLFRCPYCGRGPVLRNMFVAHERCRVCGFALKRGNPAYFSGAIFLNYLLGAGGTLLTFLLFLAFTWPDVPWGAMKFVVPLGAIASVLLMNPVSKVILLAIDVRMRPISEEELQAGSHKDDLWQQKA